MRLGFVRSPGLHPEPTKAHDSIRLVGFLELGKAHKTTTIITVRRRFPRSLARRKESIKFSFSNPGHHSQPPADKSNPRPIDPVGAAQYGTTPYGL